MPMFRTMRDELYKFRKCKKISIDGSAQGIPYSHYRKQGNPFSSSFNNGFGYNNREYLQNMPKDYTPNINAPAVRQSQYDPETNFDFTIPHTNQPKLFRPFPELPKNNMEMFDYDKAKQINEILNEIMQRVYEERDTLSPPEDMPLTESFKSDSTLESKLKDDRLARFFDITDALCILQKSLPEDHHDVVSLRQAFREMFENPDFLPTLEDFGVEDKPSKLGNGNPYENDDLDQLQNTNGTSLNQTAAEHNDINIEQIASGEYTPYEQQSMNTAENSFNPSASTSETLPDQDNIANTNGMNIFDANSAFDEINNAVDQVVFEQPQQDPWKQQEDPYNQMGLMDPFYMMPSQMGPGFGPMQGL